MMRDGMMRNYVGLGVLLLLLAACGTSSHRPTYSGHQESTEGVPGFENGQKTSPYVKLGQSYTVDGETYVPRYQPDYVEEGMASWYGPGFHGGKTANGEEFDKHEMTAAHRTLPLPSIVKVTLLSTGKSAYVRVNDRGPFAHSRIIDLSYGAADAIGLIGKGVDRVKVEYMPQESQHFADLLAQGRDPKSIDLAEEIIGHNGTKYAANAPTSIMLEAPAVKASAAEAAGADAGKMAASDEIVAQDLAAPGAVAAGADKKAAAADMHVAAVAAPAASSADSSAVREDTPFAVLDHSSKLGEALPAPAEAIPGVIMETKAESASAGSGSAAAGKSGAGKSVVVETSSAVEPARVASENTHRDAVAAAAPVSSNAAAVTGSYYIQLGAFLQETNAERLRIKAAHIGPSKIEMKTIGEGSTFYVVRMGPYATVDESTKVLAQLGSLGVNPKLVSK